MTIKRLQELIKETHEHGVKLASEIRVLEKTGHHGIRVRAKRALLKGLEALNHRRRAQLKRMEEKEHPKPKPLPRFTMYDAVEITAIPGDPEAVAGYVSGSFPNYNELVKRYPGAKHLSIATNAGVDAQCLDVETGDATPSQAPNWVRKQHARGESRPRIYVERSRVSEVIVALENDSIKRSEFMIFVADWTNVPHIPAGCDACQWRGEVGRPPQVYDESICEGYFLP